MPVLDALDLAHAAERQEAHSARLAPYVEPHLARRKRREKHPVHDFLFQYYSFRPAQLTAWGPGLAGDPSLPVTDQQRALAGVTTRLLRATASRAATLGCFGLHEWAMVYRTASGRTRHPAPLRLGHDGTDEVVESHRIGCSHFDAFRFFTPDARPLNTLSPGVDDRADFEQPGCLHAGMDLYKHAFRLAPLVPADLVADCFELAWDIRILDMRAAPYDLTGLRLDPTGEPWSPVRIETPEGKRAYAAAQASFAARGAPLREALRVECERIAEG
ncbi:3-methyladenine DNA glycosylase [Nocardioides acrostichi]|uniref:3-methyladenine DNA glycosylase n=1 Tax=Nocardioides acrostichi TaxID=2784339 RepID=A0A930Y4P0_9ACTN|nr:3-methyladenine DNA glycosylase [Nocardioides acrostichi]MBF4160400.1 3-methyladenine DNA glycosylase [Nocardioides acrostichi]